MARRAGEGSEVANEFQALGFTAAERIERLAEGEVAETDRLEGGETLADRREGGGVAARNRSGGRIEDREGIGDAGREEIGDGLFLPLDGEDFRFKATTLAHGARHKDVGEELHLDAFVAESLAVIAAAFAGIEGKRRSVEAGGQGGGGFGVEFADELPCFGVKSGV